MNPLRPLLETLAREIDWHPSRGLLFLESPSGYVPPSSAWKALAEHIYSHHFCRHRPVAPDLLYAAPVDRGGDLRFVEALTNATRKATCWESGWKVASSDKLWAFVTNRRINVFVDDRREMRPRRAMKGNDVLLAVPCARPNILDRHFCLMSPAGGVPPSHSVIHIFLNLKVTAAAPLVRLLCSDPRARALPFEAQIVNDPSGFGRLEPVILRTSSDSFPKVAELLSRLHRSNASWWRRETPILTYPLLPGVSLAEAPPAEADGLPANYGMHRCGIVAKGVLEALAAGQRADTNWVKPVEAAFERAGIDVERPYLETLRMLPKGDQLGFRAMRPRFTRRTYLPN